MLTLSQLESCAVPFKRGEAVTFYSSTGKPDTFTFTSGIYPVNEYTIRDGVITWVNDRAGTLFAIPQSFKSSEEVLKRAGYVEGPDLFVPNVSTSYVLKSKSFPSYDPRFAKAEFDAKWRKMCDYAFYIGIHYR